VSQWTDILVATVQGCVLEMGMDGARSIQFTKAPRVYRFYTTSRA
jgi:hypothetical protein